MLQRASSTTPAPFPSSPASLQLHKAMRMMLTFEDTEQEAAFWGRVKAGPLRLVELVALVVSFTTTLAVEVLAFLPGSDTPGVASGRLPVSVHSVSMALALYLAWAERPVYEKYHDWLMALLRLSSYPSLLSEEPCGSMTLGEEGSAMQVLLTVLSAVVVFRPVRAFLDGLRFPLRFRHHLVMQLLLLALSSAWNWHVCGTCFQGKGEQNAIIHACQWTTLSTTGIWLDCALAGFPMACFTFSLQLHVIFGMLISSFVIYKKEISWRMTVLDNDARMGNQSPSSSGERDQDGHLKEN